LNLDLDLDLILICDGSGTVTKKPMHFRDNKMFFCSWKKSCQIRWYIVCTALGRILYLSQVYPGYMDDTKAIEHEFEDGSSFNKCIEEVYTVLKDRSKEGEKPVLYLLGDKGYVFYLPPWVEHTKEEVQANPQIFENHPPSSFPCHVLVTDSAKYEVLEGEEKSDEVTPVNQQTLPTIVAEFEKRRPFVQLRSDIAPSRSVVERVIGRMKTIFKMNAGAIYRTQMNFLSCFLIISVGIINEMIAQNEVLFLQDLDAEERQGKKLGILLSLFNPPLLRRVIAKKNKILFHSKKNIEKKIYFQCPQ